MTALEQYVADLIECRFEEAQDKLCITGGTIEITPEERAAQEADCVWEKMPLIWQERRNG